VIGANGYIGFAVAQLFRQSGYKVYGLIRKQEHAKKLIMSEIIPVLGDATKPETYEHVLKLGLTAFIDVAFDAADGIGAATSVLAFVKKHSSPHGKMIYIYTSGLLVHGDCPNPVDESTAHLPGSPHLQKRANLELEVINSKEIHGVVIRPGFVYGVAGGNPGMHTGPAFTFQDGKIVILGKKDKRWNWVHVYDLARAYLLAVQKFPLASGQVFDIANYNPPTYEQFRRKAAEIAGHKNAEVVSVPIPANDFMNTLFDMTTIITPKKAENLLGWVPQQLSILDNLEPVYAAFKAESSH